MVEEGSRKLWAFLAASGTAAVAMFTGFVDGSSWADLQGIITSAFAAGNVGEHISRKWQ